MRGPKSDGDRRRAEAGMAATSLSPYIIRMRNRAQERIEVKTTTAEKARYVRAAERRGISLSDWIRRRLAEAAAAEIEDDEPPIPSEEDIAEALKAHGSLKRTDLRERVARARATPWTVTP